MELLRDTIHPWLGYLVLVVVLAVALLAFSWAKDSRELNRAPFSVAIGLLDLQVVLGIVVYVASQAWRSGPMMAQIHPLVALLAAITAHVGVRRADRERMVAQAHRKAGRALVLALVLVVAAIVTATLG